MLRERAALALLLAALLAPSLASGRGPWAPDEPRYLAAAREMRAGGDWLVPHLNGEVYGEKPPLYFWLTALASSGTGGDYALAGRLVSALAAAATVAATVFLARRLHPGDPGAARIAGAVLATTAAFLHHAQQGLIDPLLTATTTIATAALLGGPPGAGATAVAAAAMAAGCLAKGPVAILVPAIGVVAGTWAWRGRRAVPWRSLGLGALAAAAVSLAWLLAARRFSPDGEAYWQHIAGTLARQTVGRVTGARASHDQPPWYYLVHLTWAAAPWVVFLPGAVTAAWRGRRGADAAPLAWAGALLLAFSLMSGKRIGYVFPLFPPLAILLARRLRTPALVETRAAAALLALASLATAVAPHVATIRLPPGTTLLAAAGAATLAALALAVVTRPAPALAAAVAVIALLEQATVVPALDPVKSFAPFGRAIAQTVPAGDRLVLYGDEFDGVVGFYTGALHHDVFRIDSADHERLVAAVDAPGTLWVVAGDRRGHGDLPPALAVRFTVAREARVGSRTFRLYRELDSSS